MYTIESDPKVTAKVCGKNMRMSCKSSVMVGRYIKGMTVDKAKRVLDEVTKENRAIPFTKFNDGIGHRSGMGPGRYPVIVAKNFIELLSSVQKNAEYKGFDIKKLIIKNVSATIGSRFRRPRRTSLRGQVSKSTNISIIVEESN